MEQLSIDLGFQSSTQIAPHLFDDGGVQLLDPELLDAEAKLVEHHADEILERSGAGRAAAGLRLVSVGLHHAEALEQLSNACSDAGLMATVSSARDELGFRRAVIGEAPRRRVLALALAGTFAALGALEARKLIRALRKCMIRGDALLISAGAPAEAETALTMCAAAGFRLTDQWTDQEARLALLLVQAD